ncbi:DUF6389 family protein [Cellulosimicrobium funkei]|uniref:DUF6389 family protein n=1 Tax=Cellulosimicrobium funkei TaxID=264251 RepID=UPI0034276484
MDAATHARLVRAHLDAATPEAVRRLRAVVDALPDRAEEIVVTVFPDQDGEGTFDVVVSLDGPDAVVLDRAIAPHPTLFEVVHGEDGPVPDVPLVAPGREPYDARDVVIDTAADWVVEVWDAAARQVARAGRGGGARRLRPVRAARARAVSGGAGPRVVAGGDPRRRRLEEEHGPGMRKSRSGTT